ncbi:MAG: helix-turn-helix transcriptional regulator [Actinobacteria bacterium]|nr:helix-turn-helix transcriptional regulator [Actinomycetota bacterium]
MVMDDRTRPLFMISVAAELADMHPQTLRMYERRGLVRPKRSLRQTRLYSMEDVERLRYIQQLTNELGLNLAGVEEVLKLEKQINAMRQELDRMHARLEEAMAEAAKQVEEIHRSYRREVVTLPPREIVAQRRARACN